MAIAKNPLDRKGVTKSGERWRLMPIVEQDLDTVYWDLRPISGAIKEGTQPK